MKAIMINESEGGYQELTGFIRVRGNRALGGNLAQAIADGALSEFWDKLQAIWNSAMNPGPGGYIEGGSAGNPVGGNGGSTESTSFPDIEKEVHDLAANGNYEAAYGKIIGALSSVYADMSKYYYLAELSDYSINRTTPRSKRDLKRKTGEDAKPTVVRLTKMFLDAWISGKGYNFGDVVRSVYHEIYVHVPDYTNLNSDFKFDNRDRKIRNELATKQAETEFRGYYKEYSTSGMPEGNMKFVYWTRVLLSNNPSHGAFLRMPEDRQNIYHSQIQEIRAYYFTTIVSSIIKTLMR